MATVAKSDRSTTITVSSASAGPWDLDFRLFDDDGLAVFVNGVPRTDWTLTSNYMDGYDDNATVTFDASLAVDDVIIIDSLLTPHRADNLLNGPSLTPLLNIELARLWAGLSDVYREAKRAFKFFGDIPPITLTADRALIANDTGDGIIAGPTAGEITSAETHAQTAKAWAESDEDVEVLPGEFSAKHHAIKAQASADAAATFNPASYYNRTEVDALLDALPTAPGLITFDTGSGTWVTPADAVALEVWLKGAGGGGGGVNGLGGSPSGGAGASGNPGGYVYKLITNPAASYDWDVGDGGLGGATGNNAGSAGGDTTFTDNGAIDLTAGGGAAGNGGDSSTGSVLSAASTTSAVATGGDLNLPGEISPAGRGTGGVIIAMPEAKGGPWGVGKVNALGSAGTQDGLDGEGYGAPGTGGITVNTSGDAAGGDGSGGFIMVKVHY